MSDSGILSKLLFIFLFGEFSTASFYRYYQNISCNLAILFENNDNATAFDECKESSNGCDEYFSTKNDTFLTLESINNIFNLILMAYQNQSAIIIMQNPHTKLMENVSFINCSSSCNIVTLTTYFGITTMHENTNIMDTFFVDSSRLLFQYFENVTVSLSFHHLLRIVNQKPIDHEVNYDRMYLFLLLILLMFVLLFLMYLCICIRRRNKYKEAYVVTNAMVLIIGVCKYDDSKKNLPGVHQSVARLKHLWRDIYNYDVFICNEDTLYCTKMDIIDFVDKHLQKSHNKESVIMHLIGHGSNESVVCSDLELISLGFFSHELCQITELNGSSSLIKIIFCHGCRGESNYYMPSNIADIADAQYTEIELADTQNAKYKEYESTVTQNAKYSLIGTEQIVSRSKKGHIHEEDDESCTKFSYESNLVIIYGNIGGRAISDCGNLSKCIVESFANNAKKIFKPDLNTLLLELGRNIEKITNNAEILNWESTLRYDQIRFEVCKYQTKEDMEDNIDHENETTPLYTDIYCAR